MNVVADIDSLRSVPDQLTNSQQRNAVAVPVASHGANGHGQRVHFIADGL